MSWSDTLRDVYERVEELADLAEVEGNAPRVTHKLHEALGPLAVAVRIAEQADV